MKKFLIPTIAVLAIAGALIASPILARDDSPVTRGCCPVATDTNGSCPRTVCPVVTDGTFNCPRWDTTTQAATGVVLAAETAVPPVTNCPVVTDGVCPGNGGCGSQAGCPMAGTDGATTCPNTNPGCPAVTGTPDATSNPVNGAGCGMRGGCGMWR